MKASRYNWVFEHDGKMVLFNGATGCLAVIEEPFRGQVSEALEAGEPGMALRRIEEDERTRLIDGGFFVERDRDEVGMLRHVSLIPGRSRSLSGVTAVVTTRCNIDCRRCALDTGTGRDMSPGIVDSLVEALDRTDAAEFSISICGGEPLLVPGICVELGRKAQAACAKRGTELRTSLSTNGYLLDKRMARRISNAGVRKVRIVLDGCRENHDRTRHLRGGGPTFARIVDNVFAAAEHMDVGLYIRRAGGRDGAGRHADALAGMFSGHGKIRVHLVPSDSDGGSAGGCVGMPRLPQEPRRERLPGCAVVDPASFILMPDGSFALCWDELGTSLQAACRIHGGEGPARQVPRWMDWNPYGAPPCSECRRLPTCGGGCPRIWALTGRHECAFPSDEDYLRFVRENFLGLNRSGG